MPLTICSLAMAIANYIVQARGLASLTHYCTRFGYLPSHNYIPAHMHAIRYYKQDCERADLAHMKSSKERVKGTDYVIARA